MIQPHRLGWPRNGFGEAGVPQTQLLHGVQGVYFSGNFSSWIEFK
jgi:hypothetical protein